MIIGKVNVRAGFVLLISVLVYLDQGYLLWIVFAAAALHELGHYIPLRLLGGKVCAIELTGGGIGMETEGSLSYGKELLSVIMGPLVSLGFALLFLSRDGMIEGQTALAGMCFSHGLFNLLPMRGLDGGRVLEIVLDMRDCQSTQTILRVMTLVTASVLSVLCVYLAIRHRNVSLLLAVIYIATSCFIPNQRQKKR